MSLFPAYGKETQDEYIRSDSEELEYVAELSPGAESALLTEPPAAPSPPPYAAPAPTDFYLDRKLDRGNLRVSTLYYPARPEYRTRDSSALGVRGLRGADKRGEKRARSKRYWRSAAGVGAGVGGEAEVAREAAERGAVFRQALQASPHDEDLWMRYIDFLQWCESEPGCGADGANGAVEAAREGATRNPRSAALRSRLHAALRQALSPQELADTLRNMRADEQRGSVLAELYAREVSACACAGQLERAREVCARAASDKRVSQHYHSVLLAYGCMLRSAGLWEQLVQLMELVAGMNFPRTAGFPPGEEGDGDDQSTNEKQLAEWEEGVVGSGLPRGEVWARVERARAALHWRPLSPHAHPLEVAADPERRPALEGAAGLVAAAGGRGALRLLAALLRLAETPLLPAAHHVARAAQHSEVASDWEAASGLTLVSLIRAARRLPPAHPAYPARASGPPRRLLARTPLRAPTPATDNTGFTAWVKALWEAALQAAGGDGELQGGRRRAALICWRLRAMHAKLLLADTQEEIKAVRSEARDVVRRWAGDNPLPFVVCSRIEAGAGAGMKGAVRAARAALQAAAAGDAAGDATYNALYAARVLHELCGSAVADGRRAVARWALVCAVLARPLPHDDILLTHPPQDLVELARTECDKQCSLLEKKYWLAEEEEYDEDDDEQPLEVALLPSEAEWGVARILLATPRECERAFEQIRATSVWRRAAACRYREQVSCAVATSSTAAILHATAPLNNYLALLSSGRAWWRGPSTSDRSLSSSQPRGEPAVWAALLPALLQAAQSDCKPAECRRVYGGCLRGAARAGCAGGGLSLALAMEAAPDPRPVLTKALTTAAHCKWVILRGAALGAGDVSELAELALERGLRLHALPDELAPLHIPQTNIPQTNDP